MKRLATAVTTIVLLATGIQYSEASTKIVKPAKVQATKSLKKAPLFQKVSKLKPITVVPLSHPANLSLFTASSLDQQPDAATLSVSVPSSPLSSPISSPLSAPLIGVIDSSTVDIESHTVEIESETVEVESHTVEIESETVHVDSSTVHSVDIPHSDHSQHSGHDSQQSPSVAVTRESSEEKD